MLLSSSSWKYPPFPLLSYLFRSCVPKILLHYILLLIAYKFRENRKFVFIIVQFIMNAKSRIHFGLKLVLVCLYIIPSHYHHCANLSEDIEFIKCLSDIFCRAYVSKIKHSLSVIHYTICGAVCFQFQFTRFRWDDWENIYTLPYYHHQIIKVWTITHS